VLFVASGKTTLGDSLISGRKSDAPQFFWTRSFSLVIEDERRKSRGRTIAAPTP